MPRLHLPVAFLAIGCLLALSSSASADPDVSGKRGEARQILEELELMDAELGQLVESYNKATWELAETKRLLGRTRAELRIAQRNLGVSRRALARRVVSIYMGHDDPRDSSVAILLTASSLGDAIDRMEASERISEHEAAVVEQVSIYTNQVSKREAMLTRTEQSRQKLVDRIEAEKTSIQGKIAARKTYYRRVEREIAAAVQAERRRAEELAAAATRRVERQNRTAQPPQEPQQERRFIPPAPGSPIGSQVVAIAMQYLGVPYRWGGADPNTGFDCSGFVMYVFAKVGISLPHYTGAQWSLGVPVAREDLQPGDVVFFNGISHDGIYIGSGQFVQAPRTGDVVKVSSLSESWYASTYEGARRYGT